MQLLNQPMVWLGIKIAGGLLLVWLGMRIGRSTEAIIWRRR